ncbi:MAG: AbrB/MazE/SpoVT family DNA-binding domain-containing protein [bacterium]
MIKRLIKHGNSSAIIIDKPILDLLNIDEKTDLEIATDGEKLWIKPVRKKTGRGKGKLGKISSKKSLQKAFEEITTKYDSALKKLAKN